MMTLHMRNLTGEEKEGIAKLSHSQRDEARLVQRATIIQLASEGRTIPSIAQRMHLKEETVRKWWKRFSERGMLGLQDEPRCGAPRRYTAEIKGVIVATALTNPRGLGLPFGSWTYQRLGSYLREACGIKMRQTRLFEILHEEGLRWRQQERWFGKRVDPDFAKKRGPLNA